MDLVAEVEVDLVEADLAAEVADLAAEDVAKLKAGNQLPAIRIFQTTHDALVGGGVLARVAPRVVVLARVAPRKVHK